jgi:hypothetical protein
MKDMEEHEGTPSMFGRSLQDLHALHGEDRIPGFCRPDPVVPVIPSRRSFL